MLLTKIAGIDREYNLSRFRPKNIGLSDLLNYSHTTDDGIIICKDGALMAAWFYEGTDDASATDEQRNIISHRIFDQVFNTSTVHIDLDALAMAEDAQEAIKDVNSGFVSSGFYTSTIILMDETRANVENAARRVEKAINSRGFVARVETINTIEAYLGSLPGHGVENVRRPLINTLNLADLLPTSTIWTGEEMAPCPFYPANSPYLMNCVTKGYSPFRFNLHVRDIGHAIIFGPTGSGKSTKLGILAAQLLPLSRNVNFCI